MFATVAHLPNGFAIPLHAQSEMDEARDTNGATKKIRALLENEKFKDHVIALVSDSASPYVNAKRILADEFPGIVFLPCFAHQANVIMKDHMRKVAIVRETLILCQSVCTFFASSSRRQLYQKILINGETLPKKMTEARWNSAADMVDSVVKNYPPIQRVLGTIVDGTTGDARFSKKDIVKEAQDMKDRLKAIMFCGLELVRDWLNEAARVQDILQKDGCRLYSVLPAFIQQYQKTATFYKIVGAAVSLLDFHYTERLQRFWPVDVLVASMVLNPWTKMKLLNQKNIKRILVVNLICQLATRLLGVDEVSVLYASSIDYLADDSPIKVLTNCIADYMLFWSLYTDRYPVLAELAQHLGKITCNTVAVERLFSRVGSVHTKERNHPKSKKAYNFSADSF